MIKLNLEKKMYAIVETGGKQYKIQEGMEFAVERINSPEGSEIVLEKVVMLKGADGKIICGIPYLQDVKIICKLEKHFKAPKLIVFKYKPKKRERRKHGHRQQLSLLKVEKIEIGSEPSPQQEEII